MCAGAVSEHDVLVHSESKGKWKKGSTQARERAQHRRARAPRDEGNTRNKGNIVRLLTTKLRERKERRYKEQTTITTTQKH